MKEPVYEPTCKSITVPRAAGDHFWFVQITDTELTRMSGSEIAPYAIPVRGEYDTLLRQLRYIRNVVSPQFVVATSGNEQRSGVGGHLRLGFSFRLWKGLKLFVEDRHAYIPIIDYAGSGETFDVGGNFVQGGLTYLF